LRNFICRFIDSRCRRNLGVAGAPPLDYDRSPPLLLLLLLLLLVACSSQSSRAISISRSGTASGPPEFSTSNDREAGYSLFRARARACTFAPESDSRCSRARICFVKFHYVCPERIGVAPLSRSLASRTLVMPRSCLVNNCLIFSPSLLAPSLSRSLLRAHSLAARLAV
jgi:hypothetical protein